MFASDRAASLTLGVKPGDQAGCLCLSEGEMLAGVGWGGVGGGVGVEEKKAWFGKSRLFVHDLWSVTSSYIKPAETA